MAQDKDSIKEQVQKFSNAFNSKNAKDLAALFTVDAEFVNIFGMRMSNRVGIEAGHQGFFNGALKGSAVVFAVAETKFPTSEVAVCLVDWKRDAVPGAGPGTLPAGTGTLTMVLTKVSGQWLFAAAHNTQASAPPKVA